MGQLPLSSLQLPVSVAALPTLYSRAKKLGDPFRLISASYLRLQEPHPGYDDSRIINYHDEILLRRMKEYFVSFVDGDFEGMRDLQADNFHITDIRKCSFPFLLNRQHSNMLFRYSSCYRQGR